MLFELRKLVTGRRNPEAIQSSQFAIAAQTGARMLLHCRSGGSAAVRGIFSCR